MTRWRHFVKVDQNQLHPDVKGFHKLFASQKVCLIKIRFEIKCKCWLWKLATLLRGRLLLLHVSVLHAKQAQSPELLYRELGFKPQFCMHLGLGK